MAEATPARHEAPDVAELRRLLDEARAGSPLPWRRIGSRVDDADRYQVSKCLLDADAILIVAAANALPALLDDADRLAHMTEARDNARAEVERLTALLAEVWALHFGEHVEDEDRNRCFECGDDHPCPTIRAIACSSCSSWTWTTRRAQTYAVALAVSLLVLTLTPKADR